MSSGMRPFKFKLLALVVLTEFQCWISLVKGQDYVFTGPEGTHFIPSSFQQSGSSEFLNTAQDLSPFRRSSPGFQHQIDSYLPQRDLQTSDLPIHLQQTLPQYRFTTKEPPQSQYETKNFQPLQYTFQSSNPAPFRSQQQNIIPSTHRPNYSHLFSQVHNRDPSQTETFLGQITLQSPQELPPQFNNFKPLEFPPHQESDKNVINQNLDDKVTENTVQLGSGSRASYLNHRTRILAPDGNNKKAAVVKDYFVNTNGDVYITTKVPFSPKPTSSIKPPTTVERKNPFSPATKPTGKPQTFNLRSNKAPFVPKHPATPTSKNTFNLESLLEEPLKDSNTHSHDDDVEVVKSPNPSVSTSYQVEEDTQEGTEDYDYSNNTPIPTEYEDSQEVPEEHNHSKNEDENDIQNDDFLPEHSGENLNKSTPSKVKNTSYEVLTDKPITMVKDDNFKQFVDTVAIDNTTEDQPTTTSSSVPMITSVSSSIHTKQGQQLKPSPEDPELVVSVVTTKSVINNTIVPQKPVQESTSASPPESEENSTDTWVVVASVQTSRSVSGARYLPSPNVEQEERIKLLNEHSDEDDEEEFDDETEETPVHQDEENNTTESEEEVTTIMPTTTQKLKTSTESLIDKLDRVQSDLSSGLLTGGFKNDNNNIAVITENMPEKMGVTTMLDVSDSSTVPSSTTSTTPKPAVVIRKFSPNARPTTTKRPKKQFTRKPTTTTIADVPQSDEPHNSTGDVPKVKVQDVTAFLPPDYKPFKDDNKDNKNSKLLQEIFNKLKSTISSTSSTTPITPTIKTNNTSQPQNQTDLISKIKHDDISAFLPPGYKPPGNATEEGPVIMKAKEVDTLSALLPPDYKPTEKPAAIDSILSKAKPVKDISALLPPGYKPPSTEKPIETPSSVDVLLSKAKPVEDISALLPPGYKPRKYMTTTTSTAKPASKPTIESLLAKAKPVDDISALLPPGFKPRKEYKTTTTTETSKLSKTVESLLVEAQPVDISEFLPPGFKSQKESEPVIPSNLLPPGYKPSNTTTEGANADETTTTTTTKKPAVTSGFKVVFPSRPGGGVRKSATRLTTPKYTDDEAAPKPSAPTIQKGWPTRATTEFTGWPSPSTTPISVEELLKAARTASTSTTSEIPITNSPTTTTTTTTTTTAKPTTPGVCVGDCDLAGTIKLVGGAKWAPELLDRNTKEWQILANEVQSQLEDVYSKSSLLNKWYKKIRIDGFSEGSVLVDYLVELNDLGRQIDTQEIKKMFHESLEDALSKAGSREGKSLNETAKLEGKLSLGNFVVDPSYTDFVVLPKQVYPTVGYAEDNVLLPQWAIAVIVIGLASLLFVIIFGVTVLVNRQKNAKKKAPVPLTDDMLNELNKNHMGGFDNYGADDLYNMEDVWNDRGYDTKPPKKRSNGSIHDNSMSNLYDSWRSEWNGYYYNAYYGNNPGNPGSSHSGYGRRRSDYDTNF